MSAKAQKPFLGLAVLSRHLKFGQAPTLRTMQIFCEAAGEKITHQRLQQVEARALRKCRIWFHRNGIPEKEGKLLMKLFR